ncbi:MAG: M20/M25/M40 family metallo-hydrolase [Bernardetiaceae bacterium]|jgi:glutamate carboxypeptidase|nr:M20/M25/M40 family metallo-hydrolase [Bernardetiaceae bacterium]
MKKVTCFVSLLVVVAVCLLHQPLLAQSPARLSRTERAILRAVDAQQTEALQFLERAVNINSGTYHLPGVRAVGQLFDSAFRAIGLQTRWADMPAAMRRAGHLFAEQRGTRGKRMLLIGHLDTVFEPDSTAPQVGKFVRRDSLAYGQGTSDMKGGNVVMLYALKALHQAGVLSQARLIVALHGDEEAFGRPVEVSRRDIWEAANRSDLALAFEPATQFNEITVARRGSSSWQVRVQGKQGHSSAIFGNQLGAGAAYELARILHEFYRQLPEANLTFNAAKVASGGEIAPAPGGDWRVEGKNNVVADTAVAQGDLRFLSEEQKERARANMRQIVAQNLPGTSATITFDDGYPAMPPKQANLDLLTQFSQTSQALGYGPVTPYDPGKRGAGDIAFVAKLPGIDGLGVMGGGAHSPREYANLRTFADQVKRAAVFIYRLSR